MLLYCLISILPINYKQYCKVFVRCCAADWVAATSLDPPTACRCGLPLAHHTSPQMSCFVAYKSSSYSSDKVGWLFSALVEGCSNGVCIWQQQRIGYPPTDDSPINHQHHQHPNSLTDVNRQLCFIDQTHHSTIPDLLLCYHADIISCWRSPVDGMRQISGVRCEYQHPGKLLT